MGDSTDGGELAPSDRDRWLTGRRSRLAPGPLASEFALPDGLRVEWMPECLTLRGTAVAVAALREECQKLERSPGGSEALVEGWALRVDDDLAAATSGREITLPWHAWGIVGCLFSDVAWGYKPNRLRFSQSGYITAVGPDGERLPWPRPDIEVVVEGDLLGHPFGIDEEEEPEDVQRTLFDA